MGVCHEPKAAIGKTINSPHASETVFFIIYNTSVYFFFLTFAQKKKEKSSSLCFF